MTLLEDTQINIYVTVTFITKHDIIKAHCQ